MGRVHVAGLAVAAGAVQHAAARANRALPRAARVALLPGRDRAHGRGRGGAAARGARQRAAAATWRAAFASAARGALPSLAVSKQAPASALRVPR